MPPPAIKTVKDLIFYQYAKIIAASAGIPGYKFIMSTFKKLDSGEIKMSTALRELKAQILSEEKCCEYCGQKEGLSWDHLIPRAKNGPDTAENHVLACKSCNSSKGSKGLYEWYGLSEKDKLPRIVAGKYLKILYEMHEKKETLDSIIFNGTGEISVLDLEADF